MIFVLMLLLKNVIYLDAYKSECNQSCPQAGVSQHPFQACFLWFTQEQVHIMLE